MKILTFTLTGPLASYGETERWDYRGTEEMPMKSAVIGLLGACLGIPRGDDRLRLLDESLSMAVRRERLGTLLTDYQTVQSPTGAIMNAMRKPRGSTIITPKCYLQDACFQVFLYGNEKVLEECAEGMRHPKWVIGLGRKCNPPAIPVLPRIIHESTPLSALVNWFDPALEKHGRQHDARMRCEIEHTDELSSIDMPAGAQMTVRHDAVLRANENRYGDRRVISLYVDGRRKACT